MIGGARTSDAATARSKRNALRSRRRRPPGREIVTAAAVRCPTTRCAPAHALGDRTQDRSPAAMGPAETASSGSVAMLSGGRRSSCARRRTSTDLGDWRLHRTGPRSAASRRGGRRVGVIEHRVGPGGHPGQGTLLTGRAVFTEAYAVIPRRVMRDIVASRLPRRGWSRSVARRPGRPRRSTPVSGSPRPKIIDACLSCEALGQVEASIPRLRPERRPPSLAWPRPHPVGTSSMSPESSPAARRSAGRKRSVSSAEKR